MKTKKNILPLLLSLILFGILPFSYGVEPWEVIEMFLGAWQEGGLHSGNVLAYKNIHNQTIILRSGKFSEIMLVEVEDVAFLPLEHIIFFATETKDLEGQIEKDGEKILSFRPFEEPVVPDKKYCDLCCLRNTEWSAVATPPKKTESGITDLMGYRHTEIQIQALFNAWQSAPDGGNKNVLAALLPAILVDSTTTIDPNIYSLFEACHACEKTAWLQRYKNSFWFRLLDAQYTCKESEKFLPQRGHSFMTQLSLENFVFKSIPIGIRKELRCMAARDMEILCKNLSPSTKPALMEFCEKLKSKNPLKPYPTETFTQLMESWAMLTASPDVSDKPEDPDHFLIPILMQLPQVASLKKDVDMPWCNFKFLAQAANRFGTLKPPLQELLRSDTNFLQNFFRILSLRDINQQVQVAGYRIINVPGDGNCGFYAIYQTLNPTAIFNSIWEEEAQRLRTEMFPSDPFLSQMVTVGMPINQRERHYLPLDTQVARQAIYGVAQRNGRDGVVIINSVQNLKPDDPLHHTFITLDVTGNIVGYETFQAALDATGGNPMILLHTPNHWEAIVKIETTQPSEGASDKQL